MMFPVNAQSASRKEYRDVQLNPAYLKNYLEKNMETDLYVIPRGSKVIPGELLQFEPAR